MLRIGLGLLFMAVMMAAAGCGSASRAGVSGSVSVNGQPLEAGDLSFSPVAPQGGPTAGAAIVRGKYKVPAEQGLLPGPYKVQIHAFRGTGKKTWDGMREPRASASQ